MTDTAALMRHLNDLQAINQQLRDRLADLEGQLAMAHAQLAEVGPVGQLLTPVQWTPRVTP